MPSEKELDEYSAEQESVSRALVAWLASQEIDPRMGTAVMIGLIGFALSELAESREALDGLLQGAEELLRKVTERRFNEKSVEGDQT